MAKETTGKGLGTTGTVVTIVGIVLLVGGAYYLFVIRKNQKKKKDCIDVGGTWDEKTKTCILPIKNDNVNKVLKDAYSNLTFETGKAIIKPTSFPFLDEIVTVMSDPEATQWKLEINGHTDSVGETAFNQKLSEQRANAVKNYLVSKGMLATRIKAQGFGETKPIANNNTKDGREKNRRVEFFVVKPTGEVVTTQEKKEENKPVNPNAKKYKILKTNKFSEPPFKVGDIVEGTLDSNKFLIVMRDFEGNKNVQFQFGVGDFEEVKDNKVSETVIKTQEKTVQLIG
jgi:outer membrane protein OmpA-like peptidoglycan-associated protein